MIRGSQPTAGGRGWRRHLLGRHRGARRVSARPPGLPVAETQAGKGSLRFDHPASLGAVGATGTAAANEIARDADLVIGVGTRWSDFTTASRSAFQGPDVRFANINVTPFDSAKLSGLPVVADARAGARGPRRAPGRLAGRSRLRRALPSTGVGAGTRRSRRRTPNDHTPLAQAEVIGAVRGRLRRRATSSSAPPAACPATCTSSGERATRRATTSSTRYSCMGYEIAAGLGVKMAAPDARGRRHGRRRLVPHDELRTRHRRRRGRATDRRARRQPRLRVDRQPLRVGRRRAIRHPLPLPRGWIAQRRHRCRSTSPPTPRASARTSSVPPTLEELRTALTAALAADDDDRGRRRDRPAGAGPRLGISGGRCRSPRSPPRPVDARRTRALRRRAHAPTRPVHADDPPAPQPR